MYPRKYYLILFRQDTLIPPVYRIPLTHGGAKANIVPGGGAGGVEREWRSVGKKKNGRDGVGCISFFAVRDFSHDASGGSGGRLIVSLHIVIGSRS